MTALNGDSVAKNSRLKQPLKSRPLNERQKVDNVGKYPETVAFVLREADNIKTYGWKQLVLKSLAGPGLMSLLIALESSEIYL